MLSSTFSLQAGADPNLFFSGISPLGVAAIEGDTKFLKRLLKAKADPDAVNFYISLFLLSYNSSSNCDFFSLSLVAGILL